jgi:hypothetical protein
VKVAPVFHLNGVVDGDSVEGNSSGGQRSVDYLDVLSPAPKTMSPVIELVPTKSTGRRPRRTPHRR